MAFQPFPRRRVSQPAIEVARLLAVATEGVAIPLLIAGIFHDTPEMPRRTAMAKGSSLGSKKSSARLVFVAPLFLRSSRAARR